MKTLPDLGLPPELDDRPFAEKVGLSNYTITH
jgi:hypothetical protein